MPEWPLWHKIYSNPLYTELARLIGYNGLSAEEAHQKARPLGEKYGIPAVQEAADQLFRFDAEKNLLMLTDEARKCCFQLLGPPPEHPRFAEFEKQRNTWTDQVEKEQKKSKRRERAG
jgi:hypothetical protein